MVMYRAQVFSGELKGIQARDADGGRGRAAEEELSRPGRAAGGGGGRHPGVEPDTGLVSY